MPQDMPIGSIIMYGGDSPDHLPDNWRLCDGSRLPLPSSTTDTYWDFYVATGRGQLFGCDEHYFYLPDMRGMFVRGSAAAIADNPANEDRTTWEGLPWTGEQATLNPNGIGTKQNDELKAHSHSYSASTYLDSGNWSGDDWDNRGAETGETGGSETRPKNISMFYIIKVN